MDANTARIALAALWVVWAIFLFGGFTFGKMNAEGEHRIPRPNRMIASALLVIAAWISAFTQAFPHLLYWVALGMTFGFVGDLFMARLLIKGDGHVMGGIGAFGIGHVCYIIGLLLYAQQRSIDLNPALWITAAVWGMIGLIGWYLAVWRGSDRTVLHAVALIYALLLAGTAATASAVAIAAPFLWVVTVGAGLFLLSDLILAAQLFKGVRFNGIGDVVWLTYSPGQMLIVYGAALLWIFPVLTT